MQVVHSYHVSGKHSRQRVISTLGRYDEKKYLQVQQILHDMQRLERIREVIIEINNPASFTGKGPCCKSVFQRAGVNGRLGGFANGTS